MDFNDTPQEAEFRQKAKTWLSQNADLKAQGSLSSLDLITAEETAENFDAAHRWQKKKAAAGWVGITWPKAYGGQSGSVMEDIIFRQELARYETPADLFFLGVGLAGPTLMSHGTEQQKKHYLPRILDGSDIWCQLFSEPGAGSDLAGLRTKATKDGNDWVINGQKVWTSGGHYADLGMLVTRTDFDAPKHQGLTYFILDMKTPGVEARPIKQITGGANFNEVFFTDVRVSEAQRLGPVGGGWGVALTTLMNERLSLSGGFGDPALLALELQKLAEAVSLNGRPASEDAVVRQRVAGYFARLQAMDLTVKRTLSVLSRGGMPGAETSIVKLETGLLLQEVAAFAMELQAGQGIEYWGQSQFNEGFWQELYFLIPAMRIGGGTDEIQRNIIGERVLGLPPEQRLDKGIAFNDIPG